eukprot:scaffold950_cov340-Prasinococcus_capsulatus_cf.AAC.8
MVPLLDGIGRGGVGHARERQGAGRAAQEVGARLRHAARACAALAALENADMRAAVAAPVPTQRRLELLALQPWPQRRDLRGPALAGGGCGGDALLAHVALHMLAVLLRQDSVVPLGEGGALVPHL